MSHEPECACSDTCSYDEGHLLNKWRNSGPFHEEWYCQRCDVMCTCHIADAAYQRGRKEHLRDFDKQLIEVFSKAGELEATIQRVRALIDTQPLYSLRTNPAAMEGWRAAMRGLCDALDGHGAWMNVANLHEPATSTRTVRSPIRVTITNYSIHDRGCHADPCVCRNGEQS